MDNVLEIILKFAVVFTYGLLFTKILSIFIGFNSNDNVNRKYIKPTDIILKTVSLTIKTIFILILLCTIYAVENMGGKINIDKLPYILSLCIIITALTIAILCFNLLMSMFNLIYMIIDYIVQRRKTIFNTLLENINNEDSRLAVDNYKVICQSNHGVYLGQSERQKLLSYLIIEDEVDEAKLLAKQIVKNKVIKQKGRFNKKNAQHNSVRRD